MYFKKKREKIVFSDELKNNHIYPQKRDCGNLVESK